MSGDKPSMDFQFFAISNFLGSNFSDRWQKNWMWPFWTKKWLKSTKKIISYVRMGGCMCVGERGGMLAPKFSRVKSETANDHKLILAVKMLI